MDHHLAHFSDNDYALMGKGSFMQSKCIEEQFYTRSLHCISLYTMKEYPCEITSWIWADQKELHYFYNNCLLWQNCYVCRIIHQYRLVIATLFIKMPWRGGLKRITSMLFTNQLRKHSINMNGRHIFEVKRKLFVHASNWVIKVTEIRPSWKPCTKVYSREGQFRHQFP